MGGTLQGAKTKIIPIEDDKAIFSNEIRLPLNKMVGVIGIAPKGDAISCGAPDLHGGNMDCKEIREGATLLLPVNVRGALLAIGDLHAVITYLTEESSFTLEDAIILTSLVGDVRICQVVDPKKTIRVEFPKKYLRK